MSTKFRDGPAAGVFLILRRAPIYLRVVQDVKGNWDGLDQPGDTPAATETVCAYRQTSYDGGGMVDWTDKKTGRRQGSSFQSGTYEFIDPQPEESVLRDNRLWQEWVNAHHAQKGE